MTHRERALRALNFQATNRPAIDLGATRATGLSAWTHAALRRRLGLPPNRTRVTDLHQMLAEVEPDLLDRVGADFLHVPPGGTRPATHSFTFPGGHAMDIPAGYRLHTQPDGGVMASDDAGRLQWSMPKGSYYFDAIGQPPSLLDVELPDLGKVKPETYLSARTLNARILDGEQKNFARIRGTTDRAITAAPPFLLPSGYGDGRVWSLLMLDQPEACKRIILEQAEAMAARARQWLDANAGNVDVVCVQMYDLGYQDREAVCPEVFGEIMAPGWKIVNDAVHSYSGVKTWLHCCGSIARLIPHFIAAGVDCLNPVQWSAANMDLRRLKEEFGRQIVFWGGAVNTQRTFPFGTPESVAQEARDVVAVMAPGGGFVAAPIHNIQPDVPVDNIVALYDTLETIHTGEG